MKRGVTLIRETSQFSLPKCKVDITFIPARQVFQFEVSSVAVAGPGLSAAPHQLGREVVGVIIQHGIAALKLASNCDNTYEVTTLSHMYIVPTTFVMLSESSNKNENLKLC